MNTMKRLLLSSFLILILPSLSVAQTTKTISLKDGSALKGQLIKFENGVYTIGTSNLGEVKIQESDVVGISTGEAPSPSPQIISQPALTQPDSDQLKTQVDQMKGKFMADPEMMQDVEKMMEDPEIKDIISDPQFMQDITSYDPEKIMNNDKMQKLMNNPKMKAIMNKAVQTLPAQP